MKKPFVADDVSLELVADAEPYILREFVLRALDVEGREVEIRLDGIQVADLIADARDKGGLPVLFLLERGGAKSQERLEGKAMDDSTLVRLGKIEPVAPPKSADPAALKTTLEDLCKTQNAVISAIDALWGEIQRLRGEDPH
jgi:hypothetical protein